MKRIFFILIAISSLKGFSQDVYLYDFDQGKFKDLNYYKIKDLTALFIDDLKSFSTAYFYLNDIDVNGLEKKSLDFHIEKIRTSNMDFDFDLMEKGVLGVSKSIYDDSKISISINPSEWSNSSIDKRLYVVYHELGHDILNFKHGEGGKMMFTLSEYNYSRRTFLRDRDEMFNSYLKEYLISKGVRKKLQEISILERAIGIGKDINLTELTGNYKKYTKGYKTEGYYSNGRKTGLWKTTNLHGDSYHIAHGIYLKEGYYHQGYYDMNVEKLFALRYGEKPSGEWFYYNNKGQIILNRFFLENESHFVDKLYYDDDFLHKETLKEEMELRLTGLNNLFLKRDGKYFSYFLNGKLKEKGLYNDNKKTGEWITYYENGQIKEKYFLNDKEMKTGEWITYYENGQIKEKGLYTNEEMKTGEWITYYENGKVKESLIYDKNEMVSSICFNKNGNKCNGTIKETYTINDDVYILSVKTFKDGLLNGLYLEYFDARKMEEMYSYRSEPPYIKLEGNYIDGKKNGKWIEYKLNKKYDFGQKIYSYGKSKKISEGNYINDLEDGHWIYYMDKRFSDDEIEIESEGNFTNGEKNGKWSFYVHEFSNRMRKYTYYKELEGGYINDKKTGEWIQFYENGYEKEKYLFENDKHIKTYN